MLPYRQLAERAPHRVSDVIEVRIPVRTVPRETK
jgi:hypothetical protein